MFKLGFRGDPAQYHRYFKGSLYELVVYNRSLSDTEQAEAETFLAAKHGIAPMDCNKRPGRAGIATSHVLKRLRRVTPRSD